MKRPFLSVTGTLDGDVMGTGSNPKNRAAVFDAQAEGDKYRVVFNRGDHSVFNGGDVREGAWLARITGDSASVPDAALVRVIHDRTALLTLKFLDAYLASDATVNASAKAWLAKDAAAALGDSAEWSVK